MSSWQFCPGLVTLGRAEIAGEWSTVAPAFDIARYRIERVLPQAGVDILPGHDLPLVLGLLRAVANEGGVLKGDVEGAHRGDAGEVSMPVPRPIVRNSGPLGSPRRPVPSR